MVGGVLWPVWPFDESWVHLANGASGEGAAPKPGRPAPRVQSCCSDLDLPITAVLAPAQKPPTMRRCGVRVAVLAPQQLGGFESSSAGAEPRHMVPACPHPQTSLRIAHHVPPGYGTVISDVSPYRDTNQRRGSAAVADFVFRSGPGTFFAPSTKNVRARSPAAAQLGPRQLLPPECRCAGPLTH